jgi:uncharacterized protein YndB with AHSA1/START domain
MNATPITISTHINNDIQTVWERYTQPEHITQWNFADVSWCCPYAENDLRVGGKYLARMEAKDGSFGFDFEAKYTLVSMHERLVYEFGGRMASIQFASDETGTEVRITFDPESENAVELQQQGWQSILNRFKSYAELS